MGDQDDIVERSHPTPGGEFDRPFFAGAQQAKVISQITGQEDRRTDQRRHHAGNVNPFPVSTNGSPSNRDKAGTETVQGRVHWRKIENIHLILGRQKRNNRQSRLESEPVKRDVGGNMSACRRWGVSAWGETCAAFFRLNPLPSVASVTSVR